MTIKLDFGRLFPGLVIFLVGAGVFAIWLVFVLVSFFAFFVPGLGGVFFFTLDLLVASLVLMGSGVLLMLAGVSGWRRMGNAPGEERAGWFAGFIARRAWRDTMRLSERAGEIFGLFVSVFVILFFVANQLGGTGFFTSAFGWREQALFYGSWLAGTTVTLARAVYGKRNNVRPIEAASHALWAFSAFWLLIVFPFNFAHITDLLPQFTRFAFFWVSDYIGALVLTISVIAGIVSFVYTLVLYVAVRDWMMRERLAPADHFKGMR